MEQPDGETGLNCENEICIVGTGPAGLSLAVRLARAGCRVLLLEAGGPQADPEQQELYAGEVADPSVHWPLDTYRLRALGGTSSLWGGRCIPYDPIDFEARPWVPHSGWPIGYEDVAPYYADALEAAEAGKFDYTPSGPIIPGLVSKWLHTTTERFSRPTNFWAHYGEELTKSPNVRIITDAPVVAIKLTPDGKRVDHLEIAPRSGPHRAIYAKDYVIAAGGLETTRLLLASNDIVPQGIGNAGGWLGRGYMCHLAATFGDITFTGDPRSIGFDYERDADGIYIRRRLALTEQAQRELGLMNFTARLHIADANNPAHGDPVLSLLFLAAFRVKYEYSRGAREADRSPAIMARHIGNIARHPFRLAHFLTTWGSKRYLSSRRIPSIALFSNKNTYPLEFHCEQAPNPESRVTLTVDRDALGMQRLRVDWQTTPLDFQTVRDAYRLIGRELERTGTGQLRFDEGALETAILQAGAYGGHHSGTTRMAANPSDGVVDENCRVHGTDNLFIASGSVLPTSSQANPTLTIIALALRLADHLRDRARNTPTPTPATTQKRIFVTGAAGFVGSAVVSALAHQGYAVHAGIRSGTGKWHASSVRTVQADVMDQQALNDAFIGMDCIVHCAVGSARDTSVITEGTRNVMATAKKAGVRHIIYLSSVAVYGCPTGIIDESYPTDNPQGAYGRAKRDAESILRDGAAKDMAVTILRPSLIYGPGSYQWVDLFIERMRTGQWHALGTAGEGICNLVHVNDLAAFITHLVKSGQQGLQAYNVNGADQPNWNSYLERLNQALGLPPMPPPAAQSSLAGIRRKGSKAAAALASRIGLPRVAKACTDRALLIASADEQERFAAKRQYATDAMQKAGFIAETTIDTGIAEIADRALSARQTRESAHGN